VPSAEGLSIALLGTPVILVDGRPMAVDTRKATALLAFVALAAGPVRRDTLAGLLWPETDPDRARSTLRRTLSTLRGALGNRWLETERDLVALDGEGVTLDVATLRSLVADCSSHGHNGAEPCDRCVETLQRAVALYRGPFLAGFGLRDSVEFDDWQQFTGDELRREVATAFDLLVAAHLRRGDTPQAVAVARRRLALDQLHEPAHRQLIRAYAANGERSAALAHYRECVRVLDRELGVRPLDETTALYHAIVEGTFATPPVPPAPPPTVEADPGYQLVGRARELAILAESYAAVGPDGRLVVVGGEAGIGKSRIGAELVDLVGSRGGRFESVRCFQEESELAYGVAIELVRGAASRRDLAADPPWWMSEAARLLPELGSPPAGAVDSLAAQAHFYEAICELLVNHLSGSAPGLIFVDDAHWADEASLGLLRYLVHRLRGRPLFVAVSCRFDEVPPDHPVAQLVADARHDRRSQVITLGRLTAPDVAQLVSAAGQAGELAGRLFKESGGLPFFVVEYLDALARRSEDTSDWPVPRGVRDLLEGRISALSELGAQVLAAAAVLGRSFDPETVRDASGRSDEEVVLALDELVAQGLIVEGADGLFVFRHDQARELVYGEMTLARRRLLHRRAASAVSTRGRRDVQAAVVAHHLALAGDERDAADAYVLAGERARTLYANSEALSHFRAALALGYADPAAVHREIGDLETLAGDYRTALSSYEAAAALAPPEKRAELEHRIGALHLRRGAWELAEASLAAATEGLDGEAKARALADRSLVAHRRGEPEVAQQFAVEASELAEAAGDVRARAQARNILGILAAGRGEVATAIAELEAGLALAEVAHDAGAEAASLNNLALAIAAGGDNARAIELADAAVARTVTLGDRHREAAVRNNLADLLRAAGRHDEAMAELKIAVSIFAEVGEEGELEPEIWKLSEW
jgi:DNA-binding SARP family transcriptional activator